MNTNKLIYYFLLIGLINISHPSDTEQQDPEKLKDESSGLYDQYLNKEAPEKHIKKTEPITEPDKRIIIPQSWKEKISLELGVDTTIQHAILYSFEELHISLSTSHLSKKTGIRYKCVDLPAITALKELCEQLNLKIKISPNGSIFIEDDAAYWHTHNIQFMTSAKVQNIWQTISKTLDTLKEEGNIKTFTLIPEAGIFHVCATQKAHIEINKLLKSIKANTSTQIKIELQIVIVEMETPDKVELDIEVNKPKQWNSIWLGSKANKESPSLFPQSEENSRLSGILNIVQGVTLLKKFGKPLTVHEFKGQFDNNKYIETSSSSTQSLISNDQILLPNSKNVITTSTNVKSNPVGLFLKIGGSVNGDTVELDISISLSELTEDKCKTHGGADSNLKETVQHIINTSLSAKNKEVVSVSGVIKRNVAEGLIGLHKGNIKLSTISDKELKMHILIQPEVVRQDYNVINSIQDLEIENIPENYICIDKEDTDIDNHESEKRIEPIQNINCTNDLEILYPPGTKEQDLQKSDASTENNSVGKLF